MKFILFLVGVIALMLGGAYTRQWWRETQVPNLRRAMFSPDGLTLAVASGYEVVTLWDVPSGRLRARLRVRRDIESMCFSHDSRLLAVGTGAKNPWASREQPIQLWDVARGTLVATLRRHVDNVVSLAFDRQDALLVSGSKDETAEVWRVPDGAPVLTLQPTRPVESGVEQVAFSPNGNCIAGGRRSRVSIWDAHTGALLHELNGGGDKTLFFSSDSTLLTFDGHEAGLWNVSSGVRVAHRTIDVDGFLALAPRPELAILSDADGAVDLLWLKDLSVESSTVVCPYPVRPAVSADGTCAALREGERIHAYRIETEDPLRQPAAPTDLDAHRALLPLWVKAISTRHPTRVSDLSFSSDGKWLMVYSGWRVNVLDAKTGDLRFFVGHR